MGGCQTVFLEKLLVRRGLAVGVADADSSHRGGCILGEDFGDGAPQTTDDRVILSGHHPSRLLPRGDDGGHVDGLDGRHVKHMGRYTIGGQQVSRPQCPNGLYARAHDGDVGALAHDVGRADPEVMIGVEDRRVRVAGEAQVYRALPLVGRQPRQARAWRA